MRTKRIADIAPFHYSAVTLIHVLSFLHQFPSMKTTDPPGELDKSFHETDHTPVFLFFLFYRD